MQVTRQFQTSLLDPQDKTTIRHLLLQTINLKFAFTGKKEIIDTLQIFKAK